MMIRWRLILVFLWSAAAMASAQAAEPFLGRWAVNPDVCALSGGTTPHTSALVATRVSLWWFDGYCRIGKIYKAGAVYVQARCDRKGDVPVTLDVRGDRMRVSWNRAKPEDLYRCR
jgi:hypothetical protein